MAREPGMPRAPQSPEPPREKESFVLRTSVVGGIGEKNYILTNE